MLQFAIQKSVEVEVGLTSGMVGAAGPNSFLNPVPTIRTSPSDLVSSQGLTYAGARV